jgi:SAM-dependent methyltransferase
MNDEEYGAMRALEDTYWWYAALRGEVSARIAEVLPRTDILDAGCGSGGMLARLHQDFPEAVLSGLDFSHLAVNATLERGATDKVLQGSVNQLPYPDASFDIVISLDVLVHAMVDEAAALAEIRRVLRPGGRLILNLAAFACFAGSHDLAVHGVRRYTRAGLQRAAAKAGLRMVSATYWNFLLSPLILAQRFISRHARGSDSDLKALPAPINAILRGLTCFEMRLARHVPLPFGSSLLALLEVAK